METDGLTAEIIAAAIEVHRHVGPGLLESVYRRCLAHEFTLRGMRIEAEVALPVRYKGLVVDNALRLDFLVEGAVVVELKAVEMPSGVQGPVAVVPADERIQPRFANQL